MALLKYPERLLQPWPSLNRFAQELYAMFRVRGDGGEDEAPAQARAQAGPHEARDVAGEIRSSRQASLEPVAEARPVRDKGGDVGPPRPSRESAPRGTEIRPRAPAAAPSDEPARRQAPSVEVPGQERRPKVANPGAPYESRRERPSPPEEAPGRKPEKFSPSDPPDRRRRESAAIPDVAKKIRSAVPDRRERAEPPGLPEYKRKERPAPPERQDRRQTETPADRERQARREREKPDFGDTPSFRSKRDAYPDLPILDSIYPELAGGGGVPVFIGQVVTHTSGQPAKCHLYPDGPEKPPDPPGTVDVKIPILKDGEKLDPETWLFPVFEFTNDDGDLIYYAQPPIWMK